MKEIHMDGANISLLFVESRFLQVRIVEDRFGGDKTTWKISSYLQSYF